MTAFVLDAGALIAVDRGDLDLAAVLALALRDGTELRAPAIVIAQAWRDAAGRQVQLARLLKTVEIRSIDRAIARSAGELLASAGGSDAIDATVVVLAEDDDYIFTSDPADIAHLVGAAGRRISVLPC